MNQSTPRTIHDFILVRRRPGWAVSTHDAATLARLRATWASYRAHLTMANSHRLWETLMSRSGWVRHFFALEGGLVVPRVAVPPLFRRLRDQYRFFAERFPDAVLLIQVGRFYECFNEQAERASRLLGLRLLAQGRGVDSRCGMPLRLWARYLPKLLRLRLSVCVMREADTSLGPVKARRVAEYWEPLRVIPSLRVRSPR